VRGKNEITLVFVTKKRRSEEKTRFDPSILRYIKTLNTPHPAPAGRRIKAKENG
jgi:hypothetical protein